MAAPFLKRESSVQREASFAEVAPVLSDREHFYNNAIAELDRQTSATLEHSQFILHLIHTTLVIVATLRQETDRQNKISL